MSPESSCSNPKMDGNFYDAVTMSYPFPKNQISQNWSITSVLAKAFQKCSYSCLKCDPENIFRGNVLQEIQGSVYIYSDSHLSSWHRICSWSLMDATVVNEDMRQIMNAETYIYCFKHFSHTDTSTDVRTHACMHAHTQLWNSPLRNIIDIKWLKSFLHVK